jgi:DNA-binding MarR family transcriptional regulator
MAATSNGTEPAQHFSSPQEEALLTLMRSADCIHRAFQQRLKPFGLTATQYNVLRILRGARPNGLTCSAIGRMMITPEPDITRLLSRLKAQKLLTQSRDKSDRRVVWTRISEAGLNVLEKLDGIVEQAPKDILKGLNCTEVAQLTNLLQKAECCR